MLMLMISEKSWHSEYEYNIFLKTRINWKEAGQDFLCNSNNLCKNLSRQTTEIFFHWKCMDCYYNTFFIAFRCVLKSEPILSALLFFCFLYIVDFKRKLSKKFLGHPKNNEFSKENIWKELWIVEENILQKMYIKDCPYHYHILL